jgi:hypothetical protein
LLINILYNAGMQDEMEGPEAVTVLKKMEWRIDLLYSLLGKSCRKAIQRSRVVEAF